MTEKEFALAFKVYGWYIDSDEVGDLFGRINLGDRLVQIIPSVKKRANHYRVACMPSVSTNLFTNTVGEIMDELETHTPIIRMNEIVNKFDDISPLNVQTISNSLLEWAKAQDIEKGLEAYRNLPTDAKGAMPLRHLAALAIHGDVDRLVGYQNSFKNGDRLGFVPYITAEMIDRAVLIAQEHCLK